jgi:hypothetical protein
VETLSGSLDLDVADDASTIRLLLPIESGWRPGLTPHRCSAVELQGH